MKQKQFTKYLPIKGLTNQGVEEYMKKVDCSLNINSDSLNNNSISNSLVSANNLNKRQISKNTEIKNLPTNSPINVQSKKYSTY